MSNINEKPDEEKASKTISIELSVEDQDYISKLAKEYGLKKNTDCLRLALRVAVRCVEDRSAIAV